MPGCSLIAPNFLKVEIEKCLEVIANDTGATFAKARLEWELFQAKLCFYQPLPHVADVSIVDPKDLPGCAGICGSRDRAPWDRCR